MTSFRKARTALISLLYLTLFIHPTAFCSDYDGVKVAPLKKTTITYNGQKIAYPKTDSPEVTAVIVDIPPGGETGWHLHSCESQFMV